MKFRITYAVNGRAYCQNYWAENEEDAVEQWEIDCEGMDDYPEFLSCRECE